MVAGHASFFRSLAGGPRAWTRALARLLAVSCLANALHACDSPSEPSQPDAQVDPTAGPSRDAGYAGKSSEPDTLGVARDAAASAPGEVAAQSVEVSLGCRVRSVLPAAFVSQCTGCHGEGGQSRQLRTYTGSEAEFVAKARVGGSEMPPFSVASIDDTTLRAAYRALTSKTDGASSASTTSIVPLFAGAAAGVPVVFERDDGVLITRAAGRVRQRHELESSYGPFGPHYFEDRTYGFIVEDYTVRGESRVRVSYLPVARPEDKTNFRAFKIYGDGNVFHSNMGMKSDTALPSLKRAGSEQADDYAHAIAPYARIQSQEVTAIPRGQQRPLQKGDLLEFEFGVFIDPAAVTAGSRTSYYTDTFRYRVGQGGLTPENADTSSTLGPRAAAWLGGGTTIPYVEAEPETYLAQLALNVQHEHVASFVEGRRLFHTDFGTGEHSEGGNPAFKEHAGKLGPLFVARACAGCHPGNGGGKTLDGVLTDTSSMVFKLYDQPTLGTQLQLSEGSARSAALDSSSVTLADGSKVALTRPTFSVSAAGATPAYSARVARRLVGLGLLEAIDESSLLARADAEDCDGDGISGRANLVRDPSGVLRVGRFGWKAEKVSVEHQVADALDADLGVSTRLFPGAGGAAELSEQELLKLTAYMRLLGVPAQRTPDDAGVARGGTLFRSLGCAHCHTPEVSTGAHPFVELRAQTIQPFSDLLLHDMGEGLADQSGSNVERAAAAEWRTAPLWGIAGAHDAQGYVALLHDGRAKSVLEAILWHGGEAAHIRARFVALPTTDREAVLRFVESL